jgi:hypothetical protein
MPSMLLGDGRGKELRNIANMVECMERRHMTD